MNGITINIDPVIFHLGNFALRWYGLAIVAAISVAILVAVREGQRKGIAADDIYAVAMWGAVVGIVGARLFHVVDRIGYYLANPTSILSFQQGGLAIWGGVAGGFVAGAVYARSKGIPLARLADVAAIALLSGQIVGRLGCIVNGDAYGGPTDLPWGFVYTHPAALIPRSLWGVPTHPYPVYEMIWNSAALALLWQLRTRLRTDGLLFCGYLFLYSLGRFFLTFVRQEEVWFWGLQEAQVLALVGLSISVLVTGYLIRKRRARKTLSAASC
ncbi:MAG: prolipoprotein diacylglyceryl transferase [Chloroflexi bacterium]|nr:prolipoprotein diacylglyceryl transferase [Chloroflexota bacterium]